GATANARRLALVHVAEKMFTGLIALILLGPLWWVSEQLSGGGAGRTNISTGLALFHTLFNLLGLLLMWLLADRLLRLVERWVKQPELTSERLRYLDDTVLALPAMGVNAMHSEIKRVFKQLLSRGGIIIDPDREPAAEETLHTGVLLAAIAEYGNRIGAQHLDNGLSEQFLNLNWVREECMQLRDLFLELADIPQADITAALTPALQEALLGLMRSGELKQLTLEARLERKQLLKRLRRQRRAELLEQIGSGLLSAPEATRRLHVVALLEDSAKRILHIAEVIYPQAASAENNEPAPAEAR
ncbi:MAG TPA: hypothetical protein DCQ70_00170, partial [Halieaceae bacterium]|nr:hypothetical protein [Halieaceae bacterium]